MKMIPYSLGLLYLTTFALSARADLTSVFVPSLEWLIDSSDVIVVVEVGQEGHEKVTKTEAVLKAVDQRRLRDWPPS
jgi:hypothetical protein